MSRAGKHGKGFWGWSCCGAAPCTEQPEGGAPVVSLPPFQSRRSLHVSTPHAGAAAAAAQPADTARSPQARTQPVASAQQRLSASRQQVGETDAVAAATNGRLNVLGVASVASISQPAAGEHASHRSLPNDAALVSSPAAPLSPMRPTAYSSPAGSSVSAAPSDGRPGSAAAAAAVIAAVTLATAAATPAQPAPAAAPALSTAVRGLPAADASTALQGAAVEGESPRPKVVTFGPSTSSVWLRTRSGDDDQLPSPFMLARTDPGARSRIASPAIAASTGASASRARAGPGVTPLTIPPSAPNNTVTSPGGSSTSFSATPRSANYQSATPRRPASSVCHRTASGSYRSGPALMLSPGPIGSRAIVRRTADGMVAAAVSGQPSDNGAAADSSHGGRQANGSPRHHSFSRAASGRLSSTTLVAAVAAAVSQASVLSGVSRMGHGMWEGASSERPGYVSNPDSHNLPVHQLLGNQQAAGEQVLHRSATSNAPALQLSSPTAGARARVTVSGAPASFSLGAGGALGSPNNSSQQQSLPSLAMHQYASMSTESSGRHGRLITAARANLMRARISAAGQLNTAPAAGSCSTSAHLQEALGPLGSPRAQPPSPSPLAAALMRSVREQEGSPSSPERFQHGGPSPTILSSDSSDALHTLAEQIRSSQADLGARAYSPSASGAGLTSPQHLTTGESLLATGGFGGASHGMAYSRGRAASSNMATTTLPSGLDSVHEEQACTVGPHHSPVSFPSRSSTKDRQQHVGGSLRDDPAAAAAVTATAECTSSTSITADSSRWLPAGSMLASRSAANAEFHMLQLPLVHPRPSGSGSHHLTPMVQHGKATTDPMPRVVTCSSARYASRYSSDMEDPLRGSSSCQQQALHTAHVRVGHKSMEGLLRATRLAAGAAAGTSMGSDPGSGVTSHHTMQGSSASVHALPLAALVAHRVGKITAHSGSVVSTGLPERPAFQQLFQRMASANATLLGSKNSNQASPHYTPVHSGHVSQANAHDANDSAHDSTSSGGSILLDI